MANESSQPSQSHQSYKAQICRLNHSPYFSSDFKRKEKEIIEALPFPVLYKNNLAELSPLLPIIWITNTDSQPHLLPSPLLKQTQLIVHPNSGYDNFPADFVAQMPFPIILGNEIRAAAVVEFILSCLFHHLSALPVEKKWNSLRQWKRPLLARQKVLLVGYGLVGSMLHKILSPLVSQLFVYDPFQGFPQLPSPSRDIDILILCASLNPTSFQMVNKEFLQNFSPHLLLINAARGKLIQEKDLLEFLQDHPQAYAYLDVHAQEPYDSDQYQHLSNIRLFSHLAGVSAHLEEEMLQFEKQVIEDFLLQWDHRDHPTAFLKKYSSFNLAHRLDPSQKFLI